MVCYYVARGLGYTERWHRMVLRFGKGSSGYCRHHGTPKSTNSKLKPGDAEALTIQGRPDRKAAMDKVIGIYGSNRNAKSGMCMSPLILWVLGHR